MLRRRLVLLSLLSIAALALSLAPPPAPTLAEDIVYLTNGGKIKGKIVEESSESITIQTKFGKISYSRDKIERVERVDNPVEEFDERWSNLKANDADGFCQLGNWAAEQQQASLAIKAWNKAIEISPNHAEAREKLGFVKVGNRWLPETEAYQEQGLIWHDGRWVTPEEKKNLELGLVFHKGKWVPRDQVPEDGGHAFAGIRGGGEDDGPPPTVVVEKPSIKPPKGFTPRPGRSVEDLVEGQKAHARKAEQALGIKFEDFENEHMLIHTTQPTDTQEFKVFLKDLKDLYDLEYKIYNVKSHIWPGKLQIFFFRDKSEFDSFAVSVDNAGGAVQSGGYFIEGWGGGYSKFHISMYNISLGTLAHEMSHAFMSKYNLSNVRVMPWLNEGTAEYMRYRTINAARGKEGRHKHVVKQMLNAGDSRLTLDHMFAKPQIAGTEGWAYAIGWSLVDFMVTGGGKKFVTFLKSLKPEGAGWRQPSVQEQKQALEEAFGVTPAQFEKRWKDYITKNY